MNIDESKEIFRKSRGEMISEMNGVANVIRGQNLPVAIPNGSFLHALTLTDLMLRYTDKEFYMLTGGAGDGFIATLKDSFVSMLGRLKENGGHARIVVVDGGETNEYLDSLLPRYRGVLEYAPATSSGTTISHFIVSDGSMVRDEKPHGPLDGTTLASTVKADVYYQNPGIASVFQSRFKRIWEKLTAKS